jgi:hypothetical protein
VTVSTLEAEGVDTVNATVNTSVDSKNPIDKPNQDEKSEVSTVSTPSEGPSDKETDDEEEEEDSGYAFSE